MTLKLDEYHLRHSATPAEMDWLLNEGWRHFGALFFRYTHTVSDDRPVNVIPLRLDLEKFTPTKSQRRVWKKIDGLTVRIQPPEFDGSQHALFHQHKQRFTENVPDSLETFLGHQPGVVPCEMVEVALLDGPRLIAASYLDLGQESVSSIYGFFDPAEAHRSPGIATMLLEIEFARARSCRYYYPGYAFREPSHYDYKKQFRGLDFYDWQGGWWPLAQATAPATQD